MRGFLRSALLAAALVAASGVSAHAQEASTHPDYLPQSGRADGTPIDSVSVVIRKTSGEEAQDRAAIAAVTKLAAGLRGGSVNAIELSRLTVRMAKDAAVARVDYRLLPLGPNSVRIQFLVDAAPRAKGASLPTGVLSGELRDFPVIYKDEKSLMTAIVAGGLGVYDDVNPWFGQPELFNKYNPLAGHLPGKQTAWTEGSLELGGGFAMQVQDSKVYAFGALTGLKSWSIGQDIYTDATRDFDAVEKAYAGLLYADPGTGTTAKLSVGRQTFTLNDGFLVNMVKGSVNAGERGASYLGPRLANQFSVLASANVGQWGFNAFYINPSELPDRESDSTFLGANLKYRFNDNVALDGTLMTIPTSHSTYANPYGLTLGREGTGTAAAHLLWKNFGTDGIFLEGEAGHQWNDNFAMSAWAGYGTVGYIARHARWTPSISYRYAVFSGDDPDTKQYERWDPLLSTGLGIWLQGINFGKLTSNSNLATQRVQLNLVPQEQVNVTFDWHLLTAPQLSNLGSNPALSRLSSHQLGQEFTGSLRWAINRNLYLQSIASYAMPGEALRDIGADKPWTTLQLSLYWGL